MLTLQFELEFQKINLVNRWETVATDSKNYLVAQFNAISDDWITPITAIFTNDKDEQPYAVVVGADSTLESNECYVPWEVLKDESNVYVSAYCGNLHTTVTAQFHVYKSGYADGETPPPPSPTVYDAIMQAITNLQNGKQDKLTAGENITISSDNVISAEGGVTSYVDLTDKPQIKIKVQDAESTELGLVDVDIEGIFNLPYGFKLYYDSVGGKSLGLYEILTESLNDAKNFLVGQNIYSPYKYDFNTLSNDFRRAGMWEATALSCMHVPSFITSSFVSGYSNYDFLIIHYYAHAHVAGGAPIARCVVGKDKDGDFRIFYQFIRLSNNNDGTITSQTDWVELTGGGSQIVSGVVNANGTITFTDSDGNTFTTTGASVIGADGIGIADVHIDGGGDLIIEYTTGHMENVGHVVGADGQDYVLTAQDKSDIADIVLGELPTTQGVQYGN